jgi:N-acetylglucosamine-6-phosphate deacetylase
MVIVPGEKLKGVSLLIEAGKIAYTTLGEVKADEVIDLAGKTVFPGFIDVHVHGAAGVDVMSADLDALVRMAEFLARHGVTRWLPTFVPAAEENYRRSVETIDEFMRWQKGKPVAQVAGLHYEGPFVNEKQCGALHEQYFRTFENDGELDSLPVLASDNAKHMMTLAPEVPGGVELIKKLKSKGWTVSIGHTRADIETLDAARAAGAKHITHFFNAMTGLHHRDQGVVGWGLINDDVTCDFIADGVHVHPDMLKFLYKTKTPQRLMMISDSVLPAGLGDGDYEVWGEKIKVENGRTSNQRGSIAGSVITTLDAVRLMASLGVNEYELSQMASGNPAVLLGIQQQFGWIRKGAPADLVAIDENGDAVLTVIEGEIVHRAV